MATLETASPGSPGRLKFKCVLWSNCPVYERVKQDQSYIFSPETMQFAPQSLKNKIVTINGLDGAFLRPIPNLNLHNFISFIKPIIPFRYELLPKFPKSDKENRYSWDRVIPINYLDFLQVNNSITSGFLKVTSGGSVASSSAIGSHQTWIADGSLYCYVNINPLEYSSIESMTPSALKAQKSFCTKWEYLEDVVSHSEGNSSSSINLYKNTVCVPCTSGNLSIKDPIDVMKSNGAEDSFKVSDAVYKNINPGMHWRVLKRTPIFQGEDFSVEFSSKATSTTNSGQSSAKYLMLNKFKFLDISSQYTSETQCSSLNEDGLYDKKLNEEAINNIKKIFDFSNQIYYMIEIGVGDPDHNYWLIIAENLSPIFCHVGKVASLSCKIYESSSITQEEPKKNNNSSEVFPCSTDSESDSGQGARTDQNNSPLKEIVIASVGKEPILRKLSTYEGVNSLSLIKQEKLKISIRQHSGNIVVVFSEHENNPWVISRKDIDPATTPITTEDGPLNPVGESNVVYKTIQMLIPFGQIALMGGNRKCGFSFSPMIYDKINQFVMPQPLSVQGPVGVDDMEFLWSDKGKSFNPSVSVNLLNQQYTNEAGVYGEYILDKKKDKVSYKWTRAIDVQEESVYNYGKAPDMMNNKEAWDKGARESVLALDASECSISQGSTSSNSKLMQISIQITPGGYMFPAIDGGDPWILKDCVTPIIYLYRMNVAPKGTIYKKDPIDVSQHVLTFSDEWSETDWQKLEHSGSISFIVSDGMKFVNNQSNYLYSLTDKTFYLQISMWWEGGIMKTALDPRDNIVFTGFCHGGVLTTETNKKVLDCKIIDYSKILKDQFFLNSPFFDRMRDVNAVKDIMQLAGLRDGEDNESSFEPGSLIRILADDQSISGWYWFFFNGDKICDREFALPGSYDILQSPFMRFSDGSSYWDAIERISQLSNKVAFFDRLGVFHFNPLPYDQEIWGGQSGSQTRWTIQDWAELSKVDFFATPKQLGVTSGDCAKLGNQIVGDYKVERVVQDVMNEIKVITTTPNGEILVAGHTNYASLNDPDSPGFLGYRKPFLQMDGIFGSEATVKWVVKNYTRMFIPPIKVSFKAIGRNDIKALDVITFQPLGSREKQPLVITSVKSEVDASKGTWFQDFECLWLFPRQDVQWGNTNEIGLGLDGSISGTA